jgi:hypothetical protein
MNRAELLVNSIKLREIRCNRLLEVLAIFLHPAAVAHLLERPIRELVGKFQLGSKWKKLKLNETAERRL